ncbi:hypothetical protein CYJ66_04040 [Gardnerella vaginalis]|nr:hypothetical protein CYJ58_02590 [Gardnerella vaginalis]PKZ54418.1 hypothetical protein CYJ66_04040 [Gardnerella vaginalis]PKZ56528.1 hypothetical protein CYJ64_04040 [Gardnerella vaginalis]
MSLNVVKGLCGYADCTKYGRDSRFFALNEMNLSIFDGDSSNEEEKSRISVIKQYAIVPDIQKV